ncbi:MAG: hypothetical protein Q9163_001581 [Psora crenata]
MHLNGIAAATTALSFVITTSAQLITKCNPLTVTCPPNPGLSQSYYEIDFTKVNVQPSDWKLADYTNVTYNTHGNTGAEFSFLKQNDAPTMGSQFYFLFGRAEFVVQAAPGSGIVSSMILYSDDLDEIDWEFRGSYDTIVQTNWFGRGIYGDYSHWTAPTVSTAFTTFHTYTLDWSPTELVWSIDGVAVRTLKASDCRGGPGSAQQYPTAPMKVSLGLWDAGDPDHYNSWGGGKTPIPPPAGGYSMYVKSVKIWNTFPAQHYTYTDKTGNWGSIKATNDTLPRSATQIASTGVVSSVPLSQIYNPSTLPSPIPSSSARNLGYLAAADLVLLVLYHDVDRSRRQDFYNDSTLYFLEYGRVSNLAAYQGYLYSRVLCYTSHIFLWFFQYERYVSDELTGTNEG